MSVRQIQNLPVALRDSTLGVGDQCGQFVARGMCLGARVGGGRIGQLVGYCLAVTGA
jgi:hypothetical protein